MAQNWFKHDYNARNDDDILELRAEYGWKGYGLFYAFIETMAENEKGAINLDKIGGLSIGYNLPKEELLTFIETCLEIGLFYKDEDGFIRNERITKHVDRMNQFSEAGKKGAKKRWSDDSDRGANRGANATPNADKTREDKTREDKKREESVGTASTDIPQVTDKETWDDATRLAEHLKESICEYDPDHRYNKNPPSLDRWIKEIDRALRLDGRTFKQMEFIIDYVFSKNTRVADFWKPNIQSGKKLRQQFDKIKEQIRSEHKPKKNSKPTLRDRLDAFDDNPVTINPVTV